MIDGKTAFISAAKDVISSYVGQPGVDSDSARSVLEEVLAEYVDEAVHQEGEEYFGHEDLIQDFGVYVGECEFGEGSWEGTLTDFASFVEGLKKE